MQGSAQSAPALPAWKGRVEPTRQGSLVMQGVPMGSSEAHAGGGGALPAPTVRNRPQVQMLDLGLATSTPWWARPVGGIACLVVAKATGRSIRVDRGCHCSATMCRMRRRTVAITGDTWQLY